MYQACAPSLLYSLPPYHLCQLNMLSTSLHTICNSKIENTVTQSLGTEQVITQLYRKETVNILTPWIQLGNSTLSPKSNHNFNPPVQPNQIHTKVFGAINGQAKILVRAPFIPLNDYDTRTFDYILNSAYQLHNVTVDNYITLTFNQKSTFPKTLIWPYPSFWTTGILPHLRPKTSWMEYSVFTKLHNKII